MKAQKIDQALFFVKGNLNIPKYSLQTDTFAVGKLTLLIMGNHDDEHLRICKKHHFSFFKVDMSNLCSNT